MDLAFEVIQLLTQMVSSLFGIVFRPITNECHISHLTHIFDQLIDKFLLRWRWICQSRPDENAGRKECKSHEKKHARHTGLV